MSIISTEWWVTGFGNTVIWARLNVLDSGVAEVFDCDGGVLRYDDETMARMALLDAEFRSFEGLDEEDAALLGLELDSVEPPRAENDEDLLPQMMQKVDRGDG